MLVRIALIPLPLERDEGTYGYVAWRMSFGEVPYLDVFDHKPPVVFVLYWLAFKLFGISTVSIHLFGALYNVVTVVMSFVLVSRLYDRWTGLIAAAACALMSASPHYFGQSANTELFMMLPLIVAALFVWQALRGAGSFGLAFLGGVAVGFAILTKHSAAPVALFLGVAIILQRGLLERRFSTATYECCGLLAGCALPVLVVTAVFWYLGALDAFYEAVIEYNLSYGGSGKMGAGISLLGKILRRGLSSQILFWGFGVVGIAFIVVRRTFAHWFLLGFLIACALGVWMGLRFYPHYFLQLVPAWSAVFAVGVLDTCRQCRRLFKAPFRIAVYVLVGLVLVVFPLYKDRWLIFRPFTAYTVERATRDIYPGQPFDQSALVAEYLEETLSPVDRVFIVGSEPQMSLLAGRASATRYPYIYPLTQAGEASLRRQQEVFAAIQRETPACIAVVMYPRSLMMEPGASQEFFENVSSLITTSYYLDAFTLDTVRGRVLVEGRTAVFAKSHLVPRRGQVLLFRRRAPGDNFPDIRGKWHFAFVAPEE